MNHLDSQMNDEWLARIAANGDRAAFDELVRRYCRPLAEFAASRTPTFQDAEDIAQETFLRAYLNLKSYNGKCSLKSWLFTIAYRLIISGYRKKRPVCLSAQFAEAIEAKTTTAESDYDKLWQAVQRLSDGDRTVVWLRYNHDMTIEEIAHTLKISKVGVRVRLHRARSRLSKLVNEQTENAKPWQPQNIVCMKGTD